MKTSLNFDGITSNNTNLIHMSKKKRKHLISFYKVVLKAKI